MAEDDPRLARLTPAQRRLYEERLREKRAAAAGARGVGPGPHPLSFPQERFWFLAQLEPGSPEYNVTGAARVRGVLDRTALARAIDDLVERQDSLRTTFPARDGIPAQVVAPPARVEMPVEDLRPLAPDERERALAVRLSSFARAPFDLARGPLFRVLLIAVAEHEHVFVVGLHHAVCDGWSVAVLVRELAELYRARATGGVADLPPLALRYVDHAARQRARADGPEHARLLAFWRAALDGAPSSVELPQDRARRATPTHAGRTLRRTYDADVANAVRALAARENVTPFVLLLASFQGFLARLCGTDDVVVGTSSANRDAPEVRNVVGAFVNTLVLRTSCAGDPTFRELAARARAVVRDAHAHAAMPFERLVAELAPVRDPSRTPLFNVYFDGLVPRVRPSWDALSFEEIPIEHGNALFDLSFSIEDDAGRLHATFEYDVELFDHGTIERLLRRHEHFLRSALADPDARLSRIPLLDDEERALVLAASHGARTAYDGGVHAHHLLARRAALDPDAIAIEDGEERVTYAELDARANRLAHALIHVGAGVEARVAVCLPRSVDAIVALYATWKSGAAYVPLDVDDPPPRWIDRLADVAATALVARAEDLERAIGWDGARIAVDGARAGSPIDPRAATRADSLAYVLYTSGSTGKPKGVAIEHGALANHLAWVRAAFDLRAGDRFLLRTPFTFDASLWEIVHPLACGATLVVAPQDVGRDPARLLALCGDARISVLQTVPSLLRVWIDEPAFAGLRALRHLICAGEALDPELWTRFEAASRAHGFVVALHNLYGPSEACIDATWHTLDPRDAARGLPAVPIGRPISNASAYVLDERLEPVPIGVAAELWIGGDGLARGYWGDADLTARRFVPNPLGAGRLYRTGDLVRRLPDGTLAYVGRADRQLKIGGVRVEPGEIESELRAHDGVRDAAVVDADERNERRLVAFVVATDGRSLDARELRAFLARRLPRHLVPSTISVIAEMPLTASLKTDLGALRSRASREDATSGHEAPVTETETRIAAMCAELLGVERVGCSDDFFARGGHSLLAARLVARIRAAWQVEIALARCFDEPTVRALARLVDEARGAPSSDRIPRRDDAGPRALSFAQEGLWIAQQLDPDSTADVVSGGLRLRGRLDVDALERALRGVVDRHEALRTTFEEIDGEPRALVRPTSIALERVDLRGDPRGRDAALRATLEARARRPFDLRRGPLLRVALLHVDEREHVLAVDVHHLVADGWSLELFVTELADGYAAALDDREPDVVPPEVRYADWAEWERAHADDARATERVAHWRTALAGAPPRAMLPYDRADPAVPTRAGATVAFEIDRALVDALRARARDARSSIYPFLLATLAAVLRRAGSGDDVVIGAVNGMRARPELERVVGPFVRVVPLRLDLRGDPSFAELVLRATRTAAAAWENADVPLERIARALAVARTPGREPWIDVACDLESFPATRARFPGIETELVLVEPARAKLDLSFTFRDDGASIRAHAQYATERFDRATVEALVRSYVDVLARGLSDPTTTIAATTPGNRREIAIRGRGVDPAAVERALLDVDGVREAIVEARDDALGERELVAHVAADVDPATIDAALRARLAAAWVPSAWRVVARLPRDGRGAIDRDAPSRAPRGEFTGVEALAEIAPRDESEALVHAHFAAVLERERVGVLHDFFESGGGSLAAMRLVARLRAAFDVDLALADFYASASIAGVARTIERVRSGRPRAIEAVDLARDARLDERFPARVEARWNGAPRRWLLTGATGFLGAFLLRGLLDRGCEVLALVRARDEDGGLARIRANLARYGLATDGLERVRPVLGDLGEPDLGLDVAGHARLADEVDGVMHSGASVNFLADYARLRAANVEGTRALLALAARRGLPFHHVSTIGVYAPTTDRERVQREDDPLPAPDGLAWGYERSKWVAEHLVADARARGLDVAIHRPGRISGSARTGAWNLDDFAARMMRGVVALGAAPDLDVEVDVTPVDWVADAIVHLAARRPYGAAYHLANPRPTSFLAPFRRLRARGAAIRVVPLAEWFAIARAAVAGRPDHELAPLVEMLGAQRADVGAARLVPDIELPRLDSANARRDVIDAGIACPKIDDALRDRWIDWFVRAGAIEIGRGPC